MSASRYCKQPSVPHQFPRSPRFLLMLCNGTIYAFAWCWLARTLVSAVSQGHLCTLATALVAVVYGKENLGHDEPPERRCPGFFFTLPSHRWRCRARSSKCPRWICHPLCKLSNLPVRGARGYIECRCIMLLYVPILLLLPF